MSQTRGQPGVRQGALHAATLDSGRLIRLRHPRLPGLCRAFIDRARRYNHRMQQIERLEAAGAVFVIRPRAALEVSRTESDVRKQEAIYTLGYRDAAAREADLAAYLLQDAF